MTTALKGSACGGVKSAWFAGLAIAAGMFFSVTQASADDIKTIEPGKLTIGMNGDMPMTQVKDGVLSGTDGELMVYVAKKLGLEPKVGVEEVLRGTASLEAVSLPTDAGIDVFPAATAHAASYELLIRPELGELLRKLEATHRWIICDSAPLLALAETALLIAQVRTCLTVVRSGRTPRAALSELLDRLPVDKRLGFPNGHGS